MNKEQLSFLKKYGFREEKNLEALKVSYKGEKDWRYYWDEKEFGLHISKIHDFENTIWKQLETIEGIKECLSVLYITNNVIYSFELEGFEGLKFLNISENVHLKILKFKNLNNLIELNTSFCPALVSIELEGNFEKLEKLDLSYCEKLKRHYTPPKFDKLRFFYAKKTQLENDFIDIGKYFDEELRSKLGEFRKNLNLGLIKIPINEHYLDLKNHCQTDEFGNIVFLDLGHMGIEKIPEIVFSINTLKHLCLGSYYPKEIGEVEGIEWQKSKNHEGVYHPHNVFSSEELSKLSSLQNLESLYLSVCSLDSLSFLKSLTSLISLDIAGNSNLKDFSELKSLSKLKLFCASGVSGINNDTLKLPKNIVNLSLENCSITSLAFLNDLEYVKYAHLNGNKIGTQSLIDFVCPNKNIDKQKISSIKVHFSSFKNEGIYIKGNNLIDEGFLLFFDEPDFEKKTKLVTSYINDYFDKDEEIKIKIIKLVLVGNTRAGKTTLYDIIAENNPLKSKEPSTHGVNIFQIPKNEESPQFLIKGYDFGGQDYYHSTHWAYFTSDKTIYALIFRSDWEDAFDLYENDNIYPLNYWLDAISIINSKNESQKLDGISIINSNTESQKEDKVNVLLIQNKYDEHIQDLNIKTLKQTFDKLNIVYYNENEQNLSEILDNAKNKITYKENFIEHLEKKAKETGIQKSQLAFVKFLRNKEEAGILLRDQAKQFPDRTEDWIETALKIAHNTFDIIDFKDIDSSEYAHLQNFIVTDIEKLNDYIFKILQRNHEKDDHDKSDHDKSDYDKGGYFTQDEAIDRLCDLLNDHEKVKFVLEFMMYYKIAFKIPEHENKYLAPAFLPKELIKSEELFIQTFNKPILEYRFHAFYHGNIFSEIVIGFVNELLQENKKENKNWKYLLKKNHVFLHDSSEKKLLYITFALGSGESQNIEKYPILKVFNHGINGVKEGFIEKIYTTLDKLTHYPSVDELRKNTKLVTIEKIVYNKYDEAIDFKELICQENKNESNKDSNLIYYNHKFFRKGDFRIFLPEEERNLYRMKKIFISYSKFDEKYKDELKSHLVTLKRRDLVETFDDRDIESGSQFDPVIKQKIRECDIFICLVSVNFLNVDYIIDQEIPLAIQEGKIVLPIIIKPCDWYEMPIFKNIEDKVNLGDFNAHDKAAILTLRPEYKGKRDEQGNRGITEYSEAERDLKWLEVIDNIKKHIK